MIWALLALAAPAFAQQEACSGYEQPDLDAHIATLNTAMAAVDIETINGTLQDMHDKLPCLSTLIDATDFASYARFKAISAFFEQDEAGAVKWGLAQRYSDPELPWPEMFGEEHPFRELIMSADDPTIASLDGMGLAIPPKGGLFLNGTLVLEPRARAEVPYLVQKIMKDESTEVAYWQDGAAFPDWILTDEPASRLVAPKFWEGPVPDVVAPEQERKPLPVAQIAATSSLAVASGALYAVAAVTAGTLDQAESTDQLRSKRSTTNAMVLASGLTGAAAIGVGITILVDGRTAGFGFRF
jgi:hypothetical protein